MPQGEKIMKLGEIGWEPEKRKPQDMPLRSDSSSDYEQPFNAKPGDKLFSHAEIDALLAATSDELLAGATVPNMMPEEGKILEALNLYAKGETDPGARDGMKEILDIMRPIIEKLVKERDDWKGLTCHYLKRMVKLEFELKQLDDLKAKCDAMRELLAVLHRDGGHYVDEHGIKKAVEDAAAMYYAMREVVEVARKFSFVGEMHKALAKYDALKGGQE